MVKIVIGKEYLHYVDQDLERACRIKGEYQYAFCSFAPEGMSCNVISWKCLDIKNLVLQESMQTFYRGFYDNAMLQLKHHQEKERNCLESVKSDINKVEQYIGNKISFSFWIKSMTLHGNEEGGASEENNNISNNRIALSSHEFGLEDLFKTSVFIFVGVILGEDFCYSDNEEIYLLPPKMEVIEVVGCVDIHYDPS